MIKFRSLEQRKNPNDIGKWRHKRSTFDKRRCCKQITTDYKSATFNTWRREKQTMTDHEECIKMTSRTKHHDSNEYEKAPRLRTWNSIDEEGNCAQNFEHHHQHLQVSRMDVAKPHQFCAQVQRFTMQESWIFRISIKSSVQRIHDRYNWIPMGGVMSQTSEMHVLKSARGRLQWRGKRGITPSIGECVLGKWRLVGKKIPCTLHWTNCLVQFPI